MSTDLYLILTEVELNLHKIGSANDAEDHQYLDDAARMRSEASTSLHFLLEQYPVLYDILPTLITELETGHIFNSGWSALLEKIELLKKNPSLF